MTFKLNREQVKTEIGQKLYDLLRKCWNDDEFIAGVLLDVKSDEKKQQLIRAIENGMTDSDEINEYALDIRDGLI